MKLRFLEMLTVYIGFPLFLYFFSWALITPTMILVSIPLLVVLIKDKSFDNTIFLSKKRGKEYSFFLLKAFIVFALISTTFTLLFFRDSFLFIFRDFPWFAPFLIIPLYSITAVPPQVIIYRLFFFHRYQKIFPNIQTAVLVNALLFSFAHLVFRNYVALVGTFFAGLYFGVSYLKFKSGFFSFLEHSLFGLYTFFVGLGMLFYNGQ